MVVVSATVVTYPVMYQARFDPLRDFTPVSQITAQGYVLTINPAIPARTCRDLAHACAREGRTRTGVHRRPPGHRAGAGARQSRPGVRAAEIPVLRLFTGAGAGYHNPFIRGLTRDSVMGIAAGPDADEMPMTTTTEVSG